MNVLTRVLQRYECIGTLSVHNQEGSRSLKLTHWSSPQGNGLFHQCWGFQVKSTVEEFTFYFYISLQQITSTFVLGTCTSSCQSCQDEGDTYKENTNLYPWQTHYHGKHSVAESAFSSPHSNRQFLCEYLRQGI